MFFSLIKSEIKLSAILAILYCLMFSSCGSDSRNYNNQNSRYNQGAYQAQQRYSAPPPQQPRYDSYRYGQPAPSYGGYPQQGGSRYYSNPYAFPAQNNYPYYDGDQYYVPPSSYGSGINDNSPPQSFDQKM